jgi:hypothetical protein
MKDTPQRWRNTGKGKSIMSDKLFVVDLFDDDGGCDCLPDFYETREEAVAAGEADVARVSALILAGKSLNCWDFARRYKIRECEEE